MTVDYGRAQNLTEVFGDLTPGLDYR